MITLTAIVLTLSLILAAGKLVLAKKKD